MEIDDCAEHLLARDVCSGLDEMLELVGETGSARIELQSN